MNSKYQVRSIAACAMIAISMSSALSWADSTDAGSATPHSWTWPLYVAVDAGGGNVSLGQPRPAVWTQSAQLQDYDAGAGSADPVDNYLHGGIDIRGDKGDPTVVPVDSTLIAVYDYNWDCTTGGADKYGNYSGVGCRVYFETSDNHFLYYFGHLDVTPHPQRYNRPFSNDMRKKFQAVLNASGVPGLSDMDAGTNIALDSGVTVKRGELVAALYPFLYSASYTQYEWEHLHLGIYDRTHNWDLYDGTLLLEQNPEAGTPMLARALIDDTQPIVHQIEFLEPGGNTSDVEVSGSCGNEIDWATGGLQSVQIEALIADVFFPDLTGNDYAWFPQKPPFGADPKTTYPQTTGVHTVRTSIFNVASGALVLGPITWEQDSPWTGMTCSSSLAQAAAGCLPTNETMTDLLYFQSVAPLNGATGAGEDILYTLFDLRQSTSNYDQVNGNQFWHIVTNSAIESSSFVCSASTGNWSLLGMTQGVYQVSVEAEDWAGNHGVKSEYVVINRSGQALGAPSSSNGFVHAYVKDNDNDNGAIPSTLGDQKFWESPDIFVVPHGAYVPVNGVSGEILVTPGAQFDIYIRVHDDSQCSNALVTGLAARIWAADPNVLTNQWQEVTDGGYVTLANQDTMDGSVALLGPFVWSVPDAGDIDGSHKCLLADITSDQENKPGDMDGGYANAPWYNQVAQRNIQLYNCQYPITNSTSTAGNVNLTVTVTEDSSDPPPTIGGVNGGADIELSFSDGDGRWNTNLRSSQSASYSVSGDAGVTLVKLGAKVVNLGPVPLGAGESRSVSIGMTLPADAGVATVAIGAILADDGGLPLGNGGGSCRYPGAPNNPPPPPADGGVVR